MRILVGWDTEAETDLLQLYLAGGGGNEVTLATQTDAFFAQANIGITDAQIVQVDQELRILQPIRAGDRLYCDVSVHSLRQAHGTDIIVTKNIVTNEAGDVVHEAYTTLAGRTGEGEEGFSDATA